ncbi:MULTISPECIES: hypothetical protein [unclassified Mameliella]|uniref:hypothetical protein n=1 Tax=unclassified Mameliella TaxID=2630630 RepID=UPI00273DDC81|nr:MULTISPECIES: hypothetical protein [unclassified Mameliella]
MRDAVHLRCPSCGQPFEADRVAAARDVLSPTQRRIFDVIRENPDFQIEQIANRVWEDDPNGGPLHAHGNISAQICYANKRLEPLGLRIAASHRGIGATYSIRVT